MTYSSRKPKISFGFGQLELSRGLLAGLGQALLDDLVAELHALVADVDARSRDQLLDLLLALPAEGALEQIRALADACHGSLPEVVRCPTSLTRAWDIARTPGSTVRRVLAVTRRNTRGPPQRTPPPCPHDREHRHRIPRRAVLRLLGPERLGRPRDERHRAAHPLRLRLQRPRRAARRAQRLRLRPQPGAVRRVLRRRPAARVDLVLARPPARDRAAQGDRRRAPGPLAPGRARQVGSSRPITCPTAAPPSTSSPAG